LTIIFSDDNNYQLVDEEREPEMTNQAQYRTCVEHNGNTNVVTREWHVSGDNWKVIDRYTTHHLSNPRKLGVPWVEAASRMFSQPSAAMYLPHVFASMKINGEPKGMPDYCMVCGEPERNDHSEGWCCGPHIYVRKEYSEQEIAAWQKAVDSEPWAEAEVKEEDHTPCNHEDGYCVLSDNSYLTFDKWPEEPEPKHNLAYFRSLAAQGKLTIFEVEAAAPPTLLFSDEADGVQRAWEAAGSPKLTQAMWDAGLGCSVHRAQRFGSCHDCAMLQPEPAELVRDEVDQTMAMYRDATGTI
jgi:hypothetical protein